MPEPLAEQLESILGVTPRRITPLIGGMIGQVYRVDLPDHTQLVVKVAASADSRLSLEGYMLAYLKKHSTLPVPSVIHNSDSLLLMDFVEGDSQFNSAAQRHAAELLAALHNIRSDHFGLERDTLIGGLHQPNPHSDSWIDFFCDHRLFYMAGEALSAGLLPGSFLPRIHQFGSRLSDWLTEPEFPSLIHGDVWTTNVLASGDRIAAFLDPAIYYAHPEIELAFITLFNTFDSAFFSRYHELHPIAPGFFETRRDIYNLYPILVHVRLFGGGYVASVDRVLSRFGF
jgi:fructosamine-3-kinase